MIAHAFTSALLALVLIAVCSASSSRPVGRTVELDEMRPRKMETGDGLYVEVPRGNETEKVLSFGIDAGKAEEGRGKQKKLLQRILPMFIMPFLIQSAIIPMFLGMLKFMLFKATMVGKLALALIIFNAFKNHNSYKGRAKEDIAVVHYGYHGNGMEEYGAYIN